MAGVPRTASTGAPTATAVAAPVYEAGVPVSRVRASVGVLTSPSDYTATGSLRLATSSGPSNPIVQLFTGRTRTTEAAGEYTGRTAVRRSVAIAQQAGLPPEAVPVIEEYRARTGGYPDLSGIGSGGFASGITYPTGDYDAGGGALGATEAGVLGGGLGMWLALSAVGLVLFLMFGTKK